MADATFTLEAHGADRVVNDIRKVNNATKKLNKTNVRGGMAVLEFSRGMEDFAFAGMRGAMNNIPGLLQSLGVGMGLTGVVTVAVVAVWKLTEALEGVLNKAREARNAGFGKALFGSGMKEMEKSFGKDAITNAKTMTNVMSALADAESLVSHNKGLASKTGAKKRELEWAKELLSLTERGKTAAEINERKIWMSADAEQAVAVAAWDAVDARKESIKQLETMRSGQEQNVDPAAAAKIDSIIKAEGDAFVKQYKMAMREGSSQKYAEKMGKRKSDPIKERMINELFGGDAGFKEASRKNAYAKENIKIINEQINKQQLLLNKENESAKTAEEIAKIKGEQASIELSTQAAKALQKDKKDRLEAEMKAKMSERVVSTDQMLSSQAKAGLAGNEVRAAMDVLNIAKQSLKVMKQIASNTRKFNKNWA